MHLKYTDMLTIVVHKNIMKLGDNSFEYQMALSLTCKHKISDKILVLWSPYFLVLQVFDYLET